MSKEELLQKSLGDRIKRLREHVDHLNNSIARGNTIQSKRNSVVSITEIVQALEDISVLIANR